MRSWTPLIAAFLLPGCHDPHRWVTSEPDLRAPAAGGAEPYAPPPGRASCDALADWRLDPEPSYRALLSNIDLCWRRRFEATSSPGGIVRVDFELLPEGRVGWVGLREDSVGDPEVGRCLVGLVRSLRFDPPPCEEAIVVREAWEFFRPSSDAPGPIAFRLLPPHPGDQSGPWVPTKPRELDGARTSAATTAKRNATAALSKSAIGAVIRRNSWQIQHCYERELSFAIVEGDDGSDAMHGRLKVKFAIGSEGEVDQVALEELGVDRTVADCVLGAVRGWQFPAPAGGGPVIVTYPWVFRLAEP